MSQRLNHFKNSSEMSNKLMELSAASKKSSLGHSLLHLIDIRASQLNGCAFCLDMHIKEAKIDGEKEIRLHHVSIWRESPLFTDKERAALEFTEELTKLGQEGMNDSIYEKVRTHFSEIEITEITFGVGIINLWNRLQLVARTIPGSMDKAFGLDKAGL